MTNSESVIYFKDIDGNFVLVNQKWIDLYQVELTDIVGKPYAGSYDEKMAQDARENELRVEGDGGVAVVEESIPRTDGLHHFLSTIFPVHDEAGQLIGTGTISTDITSHKRLEQDLKQTHTELQEMAMYDHLTGACSRSSFYEKCTFEVVRHRRYRHPFSLLVVDVDQFRTVNDRFGYSIGDQTLVRVVGVIKDLLRDTDTICRLDGEEFAVLATETDIDGARILAKRIAEAIRTEEFPLVEALTACVGVTQCIQGDGFDSLLARTTDALRQAKSEGKGRVVLRDV